MFSDAANEWPRRLVYAFFGLICFGASGQASDQLLPDATAAVYWNRMARDLVRSSALNPPHAARVYAYTSIAQHSVVLALRDQQWRVTGEAQWQLRRALSTASKNVLESFFPLYAPLLAEAFRAFAPAPSDEMSADIADALGRMSAGSVLRRAQEDRANEQKPNAIPAAFGSWRSLPGHSPVEPMWGFVRPLGLKSVDEIPSGDPPKLGSNEFREALEIVRKMSQGASREWLSFVTEWADDVGTVTPPGHWNAIAEEMVRRYNVNDLRAPEVFALLNVALFDASIVCWRMKYRYLYPRPSQVDPTLRTHLVVPNFPSFTSGHATFSSAAAAMLGFFFPAELNELGLQAEKAQLSRVYAGIHYPFDGEVGSRQGTLVARHILSRYSELAERFYDLR